MPPPTLADRRREDDAKRAKATAELCRRSFTHFVKHGWKSIEPKARPFKPNRGSEALIENLQAVRDGHIRRLLISIAPGFGKSTFASVAFPTWWWTSDPTKRFICGSYSERLSLDISLRSIRVLESDWYQDSFGVGIVQGGVQHHHTAEGGQRISVGVDGTLTGFRGDAGIMDDLLNAVHSNSQVEIEKVNNWYEQCMSNRMDEPDTAPMIIIGQRLATNDIIGHLTERLGFESLILPSEFESERRSRTSVWVDPRTYDGELLAPSIHSQKYLDEQKTVQGSFGFASQYQQRPTPLEGGMIKVKWWQWFRYDGEPLVGLRPKESNEKSAVLCPTKFDAKYLTIDLNVKPGQENDNTSIHVVGVIGTDFYILKSIARPMSFLEQLAEIRALVEEHPDYDSILIEDAATGSPVHEVLQKEITGVILVPVGARAKAARIAAITPIIESGHVYLLDGDPEADALVHEGAVFPKGRRDDRIDSLAQLINYLRESNGVARLEMLAQV